MLRAPVTPPLPLRTRLCDDKSAEKPTLAVPRKSPVVIAERREAQNPCPDWQRTEVSASQVVRSPAVWPTTEETVYPASPKLAPCTVTLADPVAPLFARLIALVGDESDDSASEALPTRAPILATNR